MASFMSTVMAPVMPRSFMSIASPALEKAQIMRPKRVFWCEGEGQWMIMRRSKKNSNINYNGNHNNNHNND